LTRDLRIRQCLERRERLRTYDEQGARRIDFLEHIAHLHAVDVRNAVQAQIAIAKLRERLGRHDNAEIRAADTDVDDVGERLAGVTVNATAVDAFDEVAHLL
jgi:hypothetical protein